MLDVLSPSLPEWGRVPALCIASACRSICGVAGGASKAVLSAHFATRGNIGELNAKDGSQETVVNLLGMWVGGLVVGRIEGLVATWCWLIFLLSGHLWANWMAVRSVRLRTLNQCRASMVVARALQGENCGVEVVGKCESLFGRTDQIRSRGRRMGSFAFGGIEELLSSIEWKRQAGGRAYSGDAAILQALLEIFQREDFLIWWNRRQRRCLIVLKSTAGSNGNVGCDVYLKAMCHAWTVASEVDPKGRASEIEVLRRTLQTVQQAWQDCLVHIEQGGWDLNTADFDSESRSRLQIQID